MQNCGKDFGGFVEGTSVGAHLVSQSRTELGAGTHRTKAISLVLRTKQQHEGKITFCNLGVLTQLE
jgi:hypothetical protein